MTVSRKLLLVLILAGASVLCLFLVTRDTDSMGAETQQKNKGGDADGGETQSQSSGESNEVRSKRRTNQAKQRPPSVTTASGLTYRVLREGSGQKPGPTDTVKVAYRGWVQGGDEFDQSPEGKPAEFPLNRVIKGWQEGLQLMRVGAKFRFIIPAELAYGKRGAGKLIPADATLVFEVELVEVK